MAYESAGRKPLRIPLPWMRQGTEVGAGEAIKRATGAMGIEQCGGCKRRAAILNGRIVFVGRRR